MSTRHHVVVAFLMAMLGSACAMEAGNPDPQPAKQEATQASLAPAPSGRAAPEERIRCFRNPAPPYELECCTSAGCLIDAVKVGTTEELRAPAEEETEALRPAVESKAREAGHISPDIHIWCFRNPAPPYEWECSGSGN